MSPKDSYVTRIFCSSNFNHSLIERVTNHNAERINQTCEQFREFGESFGRTFIRKILRKNKIDSQAATLFETVRGEECETSTCFLRWLRKFTIQSSRTPRALLYVVLKTFLSAFRNEWRVCAHPVDIYLKSFLELPQHFPNQLARWAKARRLGGERSKSTDRKVRTNFNRDFGGFHFCLSLSIVWSECQSFDKPKVEWRRCVTAQIGSQQIRVTCLQLNN